MRKWIALLSLLFPLALIAQDVIKVGIFAGIKSNGGKLVASKGDYIVVSERDTLVIREGQSADFRANGEEIRVTVNGRSKTFHRKLTFRINGWDCEFSLQPSGLKQRTYYDNLNVYAKNGRVIYVNELDLEKYVAGVVESEAGAQYTKEYYKVQSIISRTYALSNLQRHQKEGFHLCDKVHCQVMFGKVSYNDDILFAAYETQNQVLVDQDINLITAAFHSNCGGHTVNAETVWSNSLTYLVGVPDTFCLNMKQSHWEKKVPIGEWESYLKEHGCTLLPDSLDTSDTLGVEAREFFRGDSTSIRLVDIRSKWKLRSTSFVIEQDDTHAYFKGRGFGHGVGLCQEGAIHMAELGHLYPEILHTYYTDVHLIDRKLIDFFRE